MKLAVGDLVIAFVPATGVVSFGMCGAPNGPLDFGELELLYVLKNEHETRTIGDP